MQKQDGTDGRTDRLNAAPEGRPLNYEQRKLLLHLLSYPIIFIYYS